MPIRPPNNRIALIYGYVVCLCSLGFIVLGLNLSIPNIIRLMAFDNSMAALGGESFRDFKDQHVTHRIELTHLLRGGRAERPQNAVDQMTALERAQLSGAVPESVTYTPLKVSDVTVLPDSVLRADYNEMIEANRTSARSNLQTDLITGLQMALVAAVVFVLHWRWLQGFSNATVETAVVPVALDGAPTA